MCFAYFWACNCVSPLGANGVILNAVTLWWNMLSNICENQIISVSDIAYDTRMSEQIM